jgi:hypothetical protein
MKTLKAKILFAKQEEALSIIKGEVLFIFRNGKWDLPKGGIEKERKLNRNA